MKDKSFKLGMVIIMKVLIICAGDNKNSEKLKKYAQNSDYIICADGGYLHAIENGISPDIIVGDFDSAPPPEGIFNIVRLPDEKDITDGFYAFKFAVSKGASEIVYYGGLGDRFDHSYANMCILDYTLERDIKTVLTDGQTEIYLIDSSIKLKRKAGVSISVYAFSDFVENVNLRGLKYKLNDYMLSKYDIIGTSNEFLSGKTAEISIASGKLLIIISSNK